jgi:hypothetical protein
MRQNPQERSYKIPKYAIDGIIRIYQSRITQVRDQSHKENLDTTHRFVSKRREGFPNLLRMVAEAKL